MEDKQTTVENEQTKVSEADMRELVAEGVVENVQGENEQAGPVA